MGQNIAIYARVSTGKQENDRQLEAAKEHLGEDAYQDATVYADVGSGASDDRNDFQQLWTDVENSEIEHVIAWEISRISRRLSTAAEFIDLCVTNGVRLETLADSFPTLSGDGNVFDKLMGQLTVDDGIRARNDPAADTIGRHPRNRTGQVGRPSTVWIQHQRRWLPPDRARKLSGNAVSYRIREEQS